MEQTTNQKKKEGKGKKDLTLSSAGVPVAQDKHAPTTTTLADGTVRIDY